MSDYNPIPVLQDAYDTVTADDVNAFERAIRHKVPSEYRDFLLTRNGGCYRQDVLYIVERGVDYFDVGGLYALNTPEWYQHDDLLYHYKSFVSKGGIPSLLPIAFTGTGNDVCIRLSDESISPVLLCDHEGDSGKVRVVAPSFSVFVSGIEYDPESSQFVEVIPVFLAAERGDVGSVRQALDHGHDLEARNERSLTILMCAAQSAQPKVVNELLRCGAYCDAVDGHGRSALWLVACSVGAIDVGRLLLEAGAAVDLQDERGVSPLMRSVLSGRTRMAELLSRYGARWDLEDNSGKCAIDVAKSANNASVLDEIRATFERGA